MKESNEEFDIHYVNHQKRMFVTTKENYQDLMKENMLNIQGYCTLIIPTMS